jgi:hypothetical protein
VIDDDVEDWRLAADIEVSKRVQDFVDRLKAITEEYTRLT